jgi:hypothetical protein
VDQVQKFHRYIVSSESRQESKRFKILVFSFITITNIFSDGVAWRIDVPNEQNQAFDFKFPRHLRESINNLELATPPPRRDGSIPVEKVWFGPCEFCLFSFQPVRFVNLIRKDVL